MDKYDFKISLSLALVYSLNLLGIFLLLPVMAIYASKLENSNIILAGFAFGVYGLMRLIIQLPLGILSDKIGRKKIIYAGLMIFILGSLICSFTNNIYILIIGRTIQGLGAVGAVINALLADLTCETNRSFSFAIIGSAIALTFSLSVIIAPLLANIIGVNGIFLLIALGAVISIFIIAKLIPNPPLNNIIKNDNVKSGRLFYILNNRQLMRLNFGVFCLHFTQMSLFIALPFFLINKLHLDKNEHWLIYFPSIIIGFMAMVPFIIIGEKRAKLKEVTIFAISCILITQLFLTLEINNLWITILITSLYFVGFNILEAILPSIISKIAPIASKGTALGAYSTCQSLGLFLGGTISGLTYHYLGINFVYLQNSLILLTWLILSIYMPKPDNVRTIVRTIPTWWLNHIPTLIEELSRMRGISEIIANEKDSMIYFKASRESWDEDGVNRIFLRKDYGSTRFC